MTERWKSNAGVTRSSILFVIAILSVLTGLISAGGSAFHTNSQAQGTKAQVSTILQLGDNLKTGMDRLTMDIGVQYNGWVISPSSTVNNTDLFSTSGGGITAPSTTVAADPATDQWMYPQGAIPNIGTYVSNNSNTLQLAVLNITPSLCAEVNRRVVNVNNVPTGLDLGNFSLTPAQGSIADTSYSAWPSNNGAAVVNLAGQKIGCVHNTNPGSNGYYFYEVLYAQ